ncbi:MAG: outer membrane beta-barrel protein [Pseudomonadota bacterium]
MKKVMGALVAALAVVLLAGSLAGAALIQEFSVGTRWKSFELTGDKNFTGTITSGTVDEQTQWYPTNFNMQMLFCPYGGLTLEYDRFGAVMQQDGKLTWDTLTLGLTARLPLEKWRLAPYAVLGLTFNSPSFEENNWWRYGWSSGADFDAHMAARPAGQDPEQWMQTGRIRNMKTDQAFGWVFGLGLDFFVTKNVALNADVRWNQASTDVTYTIDDDSGHGNLLTRSFSYDLDTVSYGLGVRFYF